MSPEVGWAVLAAFSISLILQWPVRSILVRLQIVDVPNARSSHSLASVRGAGWAVLGGAIAGGSVLATGDTLALVSLVGIVLTALIGGVEDVHGLPVRVRLVLQSVIAAAVVAAVVAVQGNGWWWIPLGAVVMVAYTNMTNFMDGVNGISALNAVAVGAVYAVTGMYYGREWFVGLSLVLAVAFLAFLPFNFRRTFLGDIGSYLLGGSVATLAIAGFLGECDQNPLLGAVLIYAADTTVTLIRRVRAGEVWHTAHRSHVYQQLTDVGLGHLAVASLVAGFTVICGGLGLISMLGPWPLTVAVLLAWVAVVYLYLCLPGLISRRRTTSNLDEDTHR